MQSVPLPTPRPADSARCKPRSRRFRRWREASRVADDPFEKLFGKRESRTRARLRGAGRRRLQRRNEHSPGMLPPNDGLTAIYDITARTVHLPDGTKLEAHSGLGPKMDDPRHVNVRMHGATPPHVYDLDAARGAVPRRRGAAADPVGGAEAIFGRTGLLTHSYLLGPNGDSNGCVSFKDYEAFLRAYKDGKVKRMVVVASIDDPQLDLRDRGAAAREACPRPYRARIRTSSQPEDDRYSAGLQLVPRLAHQFDPRAR